MTAKHPPNKVRVLTRMRINEVSLVDRGAGENCRVTISKRDDSDSRLNLIDVFKGKVSAREALGIHVDKSAEGDEAERVVDNDGDGDAGGNDHYASKVADLLVESGKHPDRRSALDHLFHTAHGAAMLQRLSKQHEDSTPMPINFSHVVKSHGIALFKHMVSEGTSFGLSEEDVVVLATEHAQRVHPGDRGDVAFAKMFSATDEAGATLREAIQVAKNAALQDAVTAEIERDSREAMDELVAIGKQRWPSLTKAQQFARAAETHPALLNRAHRRPGPSTSFAFPRAHEVAKTLAAPTFDLMPRVADETDVDDPAKAIAQLKELGRQKWPTASEAEQFLNAVTDAENAELIARALGRRAPTASSPPRQRQY